MDIGARAVAEALGLPKLRNRTYKRIIGGFLLFMMFAMPITFRHGLQIYMNKEQARFTKIVEVPLQHWLQTIPGMPLPKK